MKIIQVDNFDRESASDVLIAENVNKTVLGPIVNFLNDTYSGSSSPVWYKAVTDDHKLHKFEP